MVIFKMTQVLTAKILWHGYLLHSTLAVNCKTKFVYQVVPKHTQTHFEERRAEHFIDLVA